MEQVTQPDYNSMPGPIRGLPGSLGASTEAFLSGLGAWACAIGRVENEAEGRACAVPRGSAQVQVSAGAAAGITRHFRMTPPPLVSEEVFEFPACSGDSLAHLEAEKRCSTGVEIAFALSCPAKAC
jgi:hypothetical protein